MDGDGADGADNGFQYNDLESLRFTEFLEQMPEHMWGMKSRRQDTPLTGNTDELQNPFHIVYSFIQRHLQLLQNFANNSPYSISSS
ncbi:hypothetical protein D6C81_10360 [Aureobasidium pullulans]|nr:hypothetical protein D6C81_10360 [Aureobasidium pullulans]